MDSPTFSPPRRNREIFLYVLSVAAVLLIPLRLFPIEHPPLVDLPNHLARHAIQCGALGGVDLANYYDFELALVPNLLTDLIYAFEASCADIFLTKRILIQISIANLVIATLLLHFVIWRKPSVWPLISCLAAYNLSFSYGFENFVLSAPLAFHLLAFWILMRRFRLAYWLVCLFAAVLYVFHVITFGAFMILFAGWELGRLLKRGRGFRLRSVCSSALVAIGPGIAPVAHFLLTALSADPAHGSGFLLDFRSRLSGVYSIFFPQLQSELAVGDIAVHIATAAFVLAVVGWAAARRALRIAPEMRSALVLVALAALLAPSVLGGVGFTHVRLPFLAFALFFAASEFTGRFRYRCALALLVIAVFLVRTEQSLANWRAHDAEVSELMADLSHAPKSATIITAYLEGTKGVRRHSHTLAYAGIRHGIFVHTLFHGANTLRPKDEFRSLTHPQYYPVEISELIEDHRRHLRGALTPTGEFLSMWPERYSHILALGDPAKLAGLADLPGRIVARGLFYLLLELPG